jgi:hypothetical protein
MSIYCWGFLRGGTSPGVLSLLGQKLLTSIFAARNRVHVSFSSFSRIGCRMALQKSPYINLKRSSVIDATLMSHSRTLFHKCLSGAINACVRQEVNGGPTINFEELAQLKPTQQPA